MGWDPFLRQTHLELARQTKKMLLMHFVSLVPTWCRLNNLSPWLAEARLQAKLSGYKTRWKGNHMQFFIDDPLQSLSKQTAIQWELKLTSLWDQLKQQAYESCLCSTLQLSSLRNFVKNTDTKKNLSHNIWDEKDQLKQRDHSPGRCVSPG